MSDPFGNHIVCFPTRRLISPKIANGIVHSVNLSQAVPVADLHQYSLQMICIKRKPAFYIFKSKGSDQLCSKSQLISVFDFASLTVQPSPSLISDVKLLAFLYNSTGQFASDLIINSEDTFSCDAAQLV